MDATAVVLQVAISVVSAVAGIVVASWKLSRDLQSAKDEATSAKKAAESITAELRTHISDEQEQWQQFNRSLGRIEGVLSPSAPKNHYKA